MVRTYIPDDEWEHRPVADIDGSVHRHGERSTYLCHGCRCRDCTADNARYEFYRRTGRGGWTPAQGGIRRRSDGNGNGQADEWAELKRWAKGIMRLYEDED